MVSEMVALNCHSLAERALVPAFVFFFALLYPFALVNDAGSRVAAAAGGTVLIHTAALARIGGLASPSQRPDRRRDAGRPGQAKMAASGSAIANSPPASAPTPNAGDVWRMVARTAYVQLRFSPGYCWPAPWLGMALVWLVPPVRRAIRPRAWPAPPGLLGWLAQCVAYTPTLRRFRLSLVVGALPATRGGCSTQRRPVGSAADHVRGRGVVWKRRSYG